MDNKQVSDQTYEDRPNPELLCVCGTTNIIFPDIVLQGDENQGTVDCECGRQWKVTMKEE